MQQSYQEKLAELEERKASWPRRRKELEEKYRLECAITTLVDRATMWTGILTGVSVIVFISISNVPLHGWEILFWIGMGAFVGLLTSVGVAAYKTRDGFDSEKLRQDHPLNCKYCHERLAAADREERDYQEYFADWL